MATVYVLTLNNDGGETDSYGCYATRAAAEAVMRKTQAEYGIAGFEDELWEIDEQVIQ